jgi:membrane protein
MGAIARTISRYSSENMTDRAAGLTYYSVLSLFPALLVVVALFGLLGSHPETTNKMLQIVRQLGPAAAVDTFRGTITGVVQDKGGAGALLGIGLLGALWSASGYVAAFMRASNEVWEVPRERRFFRKLSVRVGLTIVMTLVFAVIAVALVVTGPLASAVGSVLGLGSAVVTLWSIAKWPVIVLLAALAFALLYFGAPNVRQPHFSALLPGAVLAVIIWIVASIGFAIYLANFGSYNKTYGALGAVIVLLVWVYISNNAILLGSMLNAERERSRRGRGLDEGLDIDLRDTKGKEVAYGRKERSANSS